MRKQWSFFGLGLNVFATGLVSMFMDISSEMIYPLLPLFLTDVLGSTKLVVGIIEGIAESTASIIKVFSGYLSDRFGRKKLLMGIGYGISTLSRPVIAGALSPLQVLAARTVDRFGKGIRTAPRDAIIAESTVKDGLGKAFGFHRAMDTVGAVIGPSVAFAILVVFPGNLRLVFLLSTIPGIIAVFLIVLLVREKRRKEDADAPRPSLKISSFDGRFRLYIVVVAIFSIGNFADAFLILRAKSLGFSNELITAVYLLYNVIYAASSIPLGIIADKVGLKKIVAVGLTLYSIIFAGFALSTNALHIWVLFSAYGVYKGLTEGNLRAYVASIAPAEKKATAFGVYHAVAGAMLLPASVIAGLLWDISGPGLAFAYGSVMSIIAAIVFICADRRNKGASVSVMPH